MSRPASPFGAPLPDTTDTMDKTPGPRPPRAGSVDCVRCVGLEERGKRDRAALIARIARIVRAVAEALSTPDPDLARKRAEIVAALAAEAARAFGPSMAHSRPFGDRAPW